MKTSNNIVKLVSTRAIRFSRFGTLILPLLVTLNVVNVRADILQPQHNGWLSLEEGRGLGQTFTADTSIQNIKTIQWWYEEANQSYPAASVMVSLYQGDPLSGNLLRQVPMAFAESMTSQWINADFAGVSLTPGITYSFTVLGASGVMEGGVGYAGDLYPGGMRYEFIGGATPPTAAPTTDMAFRIIAVVPEPSTYALFTFGCLALVTMGKFARRPTV